MGLTVNPDFSSSVSESLADHQSGGVGPGAIVFGSPLSPMGMPQTPAQAVPDIQVGGYFIPWWEIATVAFLVFIYLQGKK